VTSLPELSICTYAAVIDEGALSIGNIFGSNITILTLVIGLAIILSKTPILIKRRSNKELIQLLFFSSIIPLFIFQRGGLGPILGVVLLMFFIRFALIMSRKPVEIRPIEVVKKKDKAVILFKFIICVGLIVLLSRLVVNSSLDIANFLDLPTSIMGATIISLGTTLPELATTTQALKKKMYDMALGNLLGSCITSITLILGISSLISFSKVNVLAVENIMFYLLLSTLGVWYMISTSNRISRKEALILCAIYILFIFQQVGVSIFIF
jgi:cation:H+ antiporter